MEFFITSGPGYSEFADEHQVQLNFESSNTDISKPSYIKEHSLDAFSHFISLPQ